MHLLRIRDKSFELVEHEDDKLNAPYAILSHTWLTTQSEEVTFEDLRHGVSRYDNHPKAGFTKVQFCMQQAEKDGITHAWIDTCCIDKSSSERLRQAITSMFVWYRGAAKCYALLSDVSVGSLSDLQDRKDAWELQFRKSRWFTRGWSKY
jgi:hypothetical protein